MHAYTHYSIGLLFASITSYLMNMYTGTPLNLIDFAIIIGGSFAADFDIILPHIFKNFEEGQGHRVYFTHSIFPVAVILVVGIYFGVTNNYHIIWITALSYFSHLILDCIDGGVSLFYTERQYGLSLLITKEEKKLFFGMKLALEEEQERNECFMTLRYYSHPTVFFCDILFSILGVLTLFIFAPEFWFMFFGFFLFLWYHMYLYLKGKKFERLRIL
ncbi:MAG: metal-dependent hydrolase [Promethearchaeota archaeon]